MGAVGVPHAPLGIGRLQLGLDLVQRGRIQQRRQLVLAQQLAQQLAIQRQGLRAPLGQGRVPLVHVRGHVREGQRPRERRRGRRVDLDDAHLAPPNALQHLLQRRQIEHVLQAGAIRLQHDGEAGIAQRRRHQVLRLQPLRPQGAARVRAPPGQQQRARRVLAEVRGEQRRPRQLLQHQLLDLLGLGHQRRQGRGLVGAREAQHDAVVAPQALHLEAGGGAQARLQRQGPRRVDSRPERRQDADAPVAQLVAEALDGQLAVGGQRARRRALVRHVAPQVPGGPLLDGGRLGQPGQGRLLLLLADLAHEGAQRLPQFQGAARALAAPERHLARLAGGGRDDHAIARDLRDAPGGRAQQERLADARLVHHLLVQLANARAGGPQVHGEQPAIGDGAAAQQRDQRGVAARGQPIGGAVPGQARAQIGELVRWIPARQHVQHGQKDVVGQRREGVGALHQLLQPRHGQPRRLVARGRCAALALSRARRRRLADAAVGHAGHGGHDLLRQHVQRVARHARGLDLAGDHPLGDHRRLQQVCPVLGEDAPGALRADLMAGAADAL